MLKADRWPLQDVVTWSGIPLEGVAGGHRVSRLVLFFGAGCGAGDADRDAGIAGPNSTVRSGEAGRERSADDRPNIVFVMTDDMEEKMLSRMPVVRSRMMGKDVTYRRRLRHPVSVRPSRATALRGQYPHNHRITASDVPDGGALRF